MKKLLLAGLMVLGTSTAFAGGVNVDINVGIPGIGYGPIYYPPAHVVERPVVYHPPRHVYRPGYVEYGRSNKEWRKEQRRAHKRWRKQQERYWDDD